MQVPALPRQQLASGTGLLHAKWRLPWQQPRSSLQRSRDPSAQVPQQSYNNCSARRSPGHHGSCCCRRNPNGGSRLSQPIGLRGDCTRWSLLTGFAYRYAPPGTGANCCTHGLCGFLHNEVTADTHGGCTRLSLLTLGLGTGANWYSSGAMWDICMYSSLPTGVSIAIIQPWETSGVHRQPILVHVPFPSMVCARSMSPDPTKGMLLHEVVTVDSKGSGSRHC